MNGTEPAVEVPRRAAPFTELFDRMHGASRNPRVERRVRERRLKALLALVRENEDRFVEAISADFGHRSAHETRILEVFPSLEAIGHVLRHLSGWMQPQRRAVSIWFWPGRARLMAQPLGVVD